MLRQNPAAFQLKGKNKEIDMLRKNGRSASAVTTKHDEPRRSRTDLLSSEWEEFVIRFDRKSGRYVTRTACCPGAPVCC